MPPEDSFRNFTVRLSDEELSRIDRVGKPFYGGRTSTGEAIRRMLGERLEQIEKGTGPEPKRERLLRVVREWRAADVLSLSDFEFLAKCAHAAYQHCRRPSVSQDLLIVNATAFREALKDALGTKSGRSIDAQQRYFVANMQTAQGDFGARSLVEFVDKWIASLPEAPSPSQAEFAARNLYSYLGEDHLDASRLPRVLTPYVAGLLQVAIRGYWYMERQPLIARDRSAPEPIAMSPRTVTRGAVAVSALVREHEITIAVEFKSRALTITTNNYVEAEEMRDLCRSAVAGQYGQSETFGLLSSVGDKGATLFSPRICVALSAGDLESLDACFDLVWGDPSFARAVERSSFVYGRI